MADVMHFDCVACQARARVLPPGEETLVLLTLLGSGTQWAEIELDLCFEHRRRVNACARTVLDSA